MASIQHNNNNNVLFDITSSCRNTLHKNPDIKGKVEKFLPVEHDCSFCGKSSYNTKSCTRCWLAKYCDKMCQLNHWKEHKEECKEDKSRGNFYKGGRISEMDLVPDYPEASINEDAIFLDLDKCPKNGYNDHADFIPVKEFSVEKLPIEIRHPRVAKYILAESKTAVRVLVKWTSKNRPNEDACARLRGTRSTRTASGKYVFDNPRDIQAVDCPIPHCHRKADLGEHHKIYQGDVKVFTNKHVIYDEDELNKTVVDFFYDSSDRVGVIREYATKLFYTKPSSDKTFLKVTLHDESLVHILQQIDTEKCRCFHQLPKEILPRMSAFAIVISHPHGLPKKVSIGRVIRVTEENMSEVTLANAKVAGDLERKWFGSRTEEDYINYMAALGKLDLPVYKIWYDTPTCQGSSGASVLFGARQCSGTWGPYMAFHSAYDIDSKLNYFKIVRFI